MTKPTTFERLPAGGASSDLCNPVGYEPVCRQRSSNLVELCYLVSVDVVWPSPLRSMVVVRLRLMVIENGKYVLLLLPDRGGFPWNVVDDQVPVWGPGE